MKTVINHPLSTLLIIAIWVVCLIPVPETPLDDVAFIDKWTHFVMYGVLTMVLWMEIIKSHRNDQRRLPLHILSFGILMPIAMGGVIELAQRYLTTCRSADWLDFVCNTLGVVIGMSLALIVIGIRKIMKRK